MTIEEQRGQAFSGKWFRAENPLIVENLFGMITFGNETFYMVDEDGYFDGRIISPTEVEVVYRETSPEFVVISTFRFVKSS